MVGFPEPHTAPDVGLGKEPPVGLNGALKEDSLGPTALMIPALGMIGSFTTGLDFTSTTGLPNTLGSSAFETTAELPTLDPLDPPVATKGATTGKSSNLSLGKLNLGFTGRLFGGVLGEPLAGGGQTKGTADKGGGTAKGTLAEGPTLATALVTKFDGLSTGLANGTAFGGVFGATTPGADEGLFGTLRTDDETTVPSNKPPSGEPTTSL
jgi:hypothetical protein